MKATCQRRAAAQAARPPPVLPVTQKYNVRGNVIVMKSRRCRYRLLTYAKHCFILPTVAQSRCGEVSPEWRIAQAALRSNRNRQAAEEGRQRARALCVAACHMRTPCHHRRERIVPMGWQLDGLEEAVEESRMLEAVLAGCTPSARMEVLLYLQQESDRMEKCVNVANMPRKNAMSINACT